jgi:iduronate 2-sulfatase
MRRGALFLLLLTLAVAAPRRPQAAEASQPRNVLFIVADDLNTMLGCYGDPLAKTPNLDRLAARGVRFDRAYCSFPLCGPSRNSMLTGLHPNATGILANSQVFRQTIPGHPSLPELFRRNGGFAARVGKLYHYNVPASIGTAGHDDPASWEAAFNPAGVDHLEEEPRIFSLRPGQFGATLSWFASPAPDAAHTDGLVAARAEQILAECGLAPLFQRLHAPQAPGAPFSKASSLEQLRRPDVASHWYVGDTVADQQAAAVSLFQFAAATYGYGHCPVVDARISEPLQLLDWLS